MAALGDIASGFSGLGGAVSALFGAKGARQAGRSYDEAARLALQNAEIAKQATNIKLMQDERKIYKVIGAQKAQVGGAGFAASGTALDLLADSAAQGALTKALTHEQGAITVNSYKEQANQFLGLKDAANTSATGQTIGGILQGAAGGLGLYSGASTLLSGGGSAGALDFGVLLEEAAPAAAFL